MYHVELTATARKALKKLDRQQAQLITAWIRKNLEGCEDPRRLGRAFTANRAGQWRYRIGDYRLLAEISDQTVTVLLLNVGHRRQVYEG